MPQYFAPGVYVEEVSSGNKPIAGVGTSTAGFIGVVADTVTMPLRPGRTGRADTETAAAADYYAVAPAGEPRLITSWESFRTSFGDIQAGNTTLAHAVYGFFNNGGTRCWITRIAAAAAAATEKPKTGAAAVVTPGLDIPVAAAQAALEGFKAIDEIALVAIPGATDAATQNALLDHCGNAFLQDRFAILDGTQNPTQLAREQIAGGVNASSYGAVYFPWITVYDPATNRNQVVPPSGHVAGVYARVDAERGVHKAPANEIIRGALDVERLVGKEDQAGLNPAGVNAIRKFGGDIKIWGARTLADDPEWRYVNVRRLFLFLRESIDEGTQWVVFEPNDTALWAKIRRNVNAFLLNVWRSGALFGATPDEAFFVRCDESTNPPDVRDLGQVITEIGVAVSRPAEFVIFRISQWAGPEGQ